MHELKLRDGLGERREGCRIRVVRIVGYGEVVRNRWGWWISEGIGSFLAL